MFVGQVGNLPHGFATNNLENRTMNPMRREFLAATTIGGLSAATAGILAPAATAADPNGKTAEEVSPGEDLMREHGVLKRILLIYGEAVRRIEAKEELPPAPVADAAKIVRAFIEDYHEKLEEDFLFPRFRKANRLVELVDVLTAQHRAGRKLTDTTLQLATPQGVKLEEGRRGLADSLRQFIRMYSPHEAREDTVLFPAFHDLVTQREYDVLGDEFEKRENQLFGQDGFEKNVDRVAAIEKSLGIYDLAQFTPRS
jgi:hemerythrin-like domain-containing protein